MRKKRLPCDLCVLNPWSAPPACGKPYHITTLLYEAEGFGIGEMPDGSCLYFVRFCGECCAFTNLVGFRPEHIWAVRACLAGEWTEAEEVKRSAETIRAWVTKRRAEG